MFSCAVWDFSPISHWCTPIAALGQVACAWLGLTRRLDHGTAAFSSPKPSRRAICQNFYLSSWTVHQVSWIVDSCEESARRQRSCSADSSSLVSCTWANNLFETTSARWLPNTAESAPHSETYSKRTKNFDPLPLTTLEASYMTLYEYTQSEQ